MKQGTIQTLFALLRSAICCTGLTETERAQFSKDQLSDIIAIAKNHDIAHLIALGLEQNSLILKENKEIERMIFNAVYRYEQLNYEYDRLCSVLESAKIPFMPLKGSVLRRYYPEPWMRTSCDIDILIHEYDIKNALSILIEKNSYSYQTKGSHDISIFSPSGIHIELHYNLIEDKMANESSSVLQTVWETAILHNGYNYWYEMTDEMFYFYHIAHMAKHFEIGGCGVRPIIDLWILDNIEGVDDFKRNELLKQGNLLKFANSVRKLSRIWLGEIEEDELSIKMQNFILRGGVYGNNVNKVAVQQSKKGGKLSYALSRIWLPYDALKFHYPSLEGKKWLLPLYEIRRWLKLIFRGGVKRSIKELKINQNISREEMNLTKKFLEEIGL